MDVDVKLMQWEKFFFCFYNIDKFNYDGDFIESQAFAYLAIRSYFKKNISFPSTTKVNKPISGGETFKNY